MRFDFKIDDNVSLRLLHQQDAAALFALIDENRAYLRKWMGWVDKTLQVSDTEAAIQRALDRLAANNGFTLAICYQNQLVGHIGYLPNLSWKDRQVEIGYWLAEAHQGRGIITRACRALIDHAFLEWDMNRIEMRCAVGNLKSRAIPERLGFKLEGILRESIDINGTLHDFAVYALLAREWEIISRTHETGR